MGVVSSDVLAAILTNYRTLFATDFKAALALQPWRQIAMQQNSVTKTESYNWFGTPPEPVDVTHGEPQLEGLYPYEFNITNKTWKAALEVERTMIEDDRLGIVMPRVRQLGPSCAAHPGKLIYQLFELGGNAFDATAFFADTRVLGKSANIDNIVGGAYGAGTVAEFQAGIAAGRAAMRAFQDDQGRPMGLIPNVIVVPPALEQTAFQALNANQGTINQPAIPATESGAFSASGYLVICNPYLTTVDDWYMLHVAGAIRPFIYQQRLAPALEGITTPNTESGVIRDKFVYSARARYEVGYGDPRHAVKILDV